MGTEMKTFLAATALIVFSAGAALAQQVGSVSEIDGEVWVVRGEQTYTLGKGDGIFDGDRVITQKGGTATISIDSCAKALPEQASILVDDAFCDKSPVILGSGTETVFGAEGPVGTAPFVLGAALLGAAGLAATDDDSPTSP